MAMQWKNLRLVNRAGGLSQFLLIQRKLSLIRRTVIMKGWVKKKMTLRRWCVENRDKPKDPKENRSQNEAESILIQRLNEKLDEIERKREKVEGTKSAKVFLRWMQIKILFKTDSDLFQLDSKDRIWIGIDLRIYSEKSGFRGRSYSFWRRHLSRIPSNFRPCDMMEVLLSHHSLSIYRFQKVSGLIFPKQVDSREGARRTKS